MIKKDDSAHERMFGRVSKIPIATAFSELVEIEFADYGDYAAFLRILYTFSRFPVVVFTGRRQMTCKLQKWPAGRRFRIGRRRLVRLGLL